MRPSPSHGSVEQGERDDGRLAGAGRRHDDRPSVVAQRLADVVEGVDDRQVAWNVGRDRGRRPIGHASVARSQPSAGEPRNGPGSFGPGTVIDDHQVVSAMASATAPHSCGLPTLGAGGDDTVDTDERERGEFAETDRLHGGAIGVAEHEEAVGERAEEGLRIARARRDDQVDAGIRAAERFEDARRGPQDPAALVGVRIEDHRGEMERGQPVHQRARLTRRAIDQRCQAEVAGELLADRRSERGGGVGHGWRS